MAVEGRAGGEIEGRRRKATRVHVEGLRVGSKCEGGRLAGWGREAADEARHFPFSSLFVVVVLSSARLKPTERAPEG